MPKVFTSKTQIKGLFGENLAVKYLLSQEFDVLERNFTKKFGEIDIVAKKGSTVYFVEVKTKIIDKIEYFEHNKKAIINGLFELINHNKNKKFQTIIKIYLAKNKIKNYKIAFLGVIYIKENKKAKITFDDNVIL